MKFGTSVLIFFIAIVALVAEFILYMIFGFGAAFSSDINALSNTAYFFVSLMIITIAAGILAPITALIEMATKVKNIGIKIYLILIGVLILILIIAGKFMDRPSSENKLLNNDVSISKDSVNTLTIQDDTKTSYFENITIKKVSVDKNILGEMGVFGEIKNNGNRILNEVEIVIYCLDNDGNPIFEKKYHPILVSNFSMTDNEPLKPNYSRKFGVKLDDAPSEWSKKVKIEVIDIKFSEEVQ